MEKTKGGIRGVGGWVGKGGRERDGRARKGNQ